MNDINDPGYWSGAYRRGEAYWDLGTPTPVFEDILLDPQQMPGGTQRFVPGSVLIPCSGHGYDALLFARHGFSVTALDFAPEPLHALREASLSEGHPVEILQQDMFDMPEEYSGKFDYILEYTCLCAIDPERREEYVKLLCRLLRPGGWVIGLIFPVDGRAGGPPFNVNVADLEAMLERKFRILDQRVHAKSIKPRKDRELFVIWEKLR